MTGRAGPARVAIVGGGLAGLAAAVALAEHGLDLRLFEARRRLGGRAASFADPESAQDVDHCQHVSMGCCTNLADFCRRVGAERDFTRERRLHFFTADGRRSQVAAGWLPAPLHLAPSLLRLHYLTWGERIGVARAMWRLIRARDGEPFAAQTAGDWLRAQRQSQRAIERFWSVVLVSALGETVERASITAARKVFCDGFLAARSAYEVYVPRVSLSKLYGERLEAWLLDHGVGLHLQAAVESVDVAPGHAPAVVVAGRSVEAEAVIVAAPWHKVADLLPPPLAARAPQLPAAARIEASPITAVHLWFDRPITDLPHAVLVGMLSQWVFRRPADGRDEPARSGAGEGAAAQGEHYYQVVISGSRELAGRDRGDVVQEICQELAGVWPAARDARLLRWKIVTDPAAVFSVRPGVERFRPLQRTGVAGLFVAGDWTQTGWPATMEGAVRSGYLAAEEVLRFLGKPARVVAPDLPRGWLARWVLPPTA